MMLIETAQRKAEAREEVEILERKEKIKKKRLKD